MRAQYLQVLGLNDGATEKEIKKAYRRLSKKYHPDVNPSESAVEKFIEIDRAYDYLLNTPRETVSSFQKSTHSTYTHTPDPRAEWKARMRRKAWEEAEARKSLLRSILGKFDYFLYAMLAMNMMLCIDMLIPPKPVPQTLEYVERGYSRKGSARSGERYWYDDVRFTNHRMRFDKQLVDWSNPALTYEVNVSRIFGAPRWVIISGDDPRQKLKPAVGVFHFWVYLIPLIFLISAVYKFAPLSLDNRLTLAIFLIVPWILQCYVIAKYA